MLGYVHEKILSAPGWKVSLEYLVVSGWIESVRFKWIYFCFQNDQATRDPLLLRVARSRVIAPHLQWGDPIPIIVALLRPDPPPPPPSFFFFFGNLLCWLELWNWSDFFLLKRLSTTLISRNCFRRPIHFELCFKPLTCKWDGPKTTVTMKKQDELAALYGSSSGSFWVPCLCIIEAIMINSKKVCQLIWDSRNILFYKTTLAVTICILSCPVPIKGHAFFIILFRLNVLRWFAFLRTNIYGFLGFKQLLTITLG